MPSADAGKSLPEIGELFSPEDQLHGYNQSMPSHRFSLRRMLWLVTLIAVGAALYTMLANGSRREFWTNHSGPPHTWNGPFGS